MPLALFALMIGAFAIGTTEFVIVGLIPTIAQDLATTLPSTGLLVSLYALSVAISSPLLTAQSPWVILISTFLLGLIIFAHVPPLQLLVVEQAKQDTPQSVDVASGLNTSE